MTDIAAFLTARLNADEALAHGATQFNGLHWDCPSTGVVGFGPPDEEMRSLGDRDLAEHITTWDPARVLAEIAAKRAIIDAHPNVNDGDCGTCVRGGWGYPTHGGSTIEHWPCPTLRLLAAVYADHEDFDPAWSVA